MHAIRPRKESSPSPLDSRAVSIDINSPSTHHHPIVYGLRFLGTVIDNPAILSVLKDRDLLFPAINFFIMNIFSVWIARRSMYIIVNECPVSSHLE